MNMVAKMSFKIDVEVFVLEHAEGLHLPRYATLGSSGMDLVAAVENDLSIQPFERKLVPTGLKFIIPDGFEMQIRPRSGLAREFGITLANSPATIDSDYRGEVSICLVNLGNTEYVVTRGLRIAQAVFAPTTFATLKKVSQENFESKTTQRGSGGFGSTGGF